MSDSPTQRSSSPKSTPTPTPTATWTPSPEVVAVLPDISGNTINGRGEADIRRPTPVMWHDSDILAHGELQNWFRANGSGLEARKHRLANKEFRERPLPPVAAAPADASPAENAARIKAAALAHEADMVGIARIDPSWVFEGYEANYAWIIVLGVVMDYACLSTAPSAKSQAEVQKQYGRGTRAAHKLAGWMHEQGWDAEPHGGPEAGPVLLIPAAVAAGLGELGKHGSMINPTYGSSFRLACVMTDIPLVADVLNVFGADDFCTSCQVCSRVCPVDAIGPEKQTVRGVDKWYVDFDKCIPYFVEHEGCGICIGQCPWSRTGIAPRLAEKMTRRRAG